MSAYRANAKRLVGCLLPGLLCAAVLFGQGPAPPSRQTNALPPTIGEPLTIAPVDLPDIDCSIHAWDPDSQKPVLTLLCPPEPVFAPLRVYLRLSWLKPEDVPRDVGRVIARPKSATRIRTNKETLMVRLEVAEEPGRHSKAKWVNFNGVVDVALIKEARPRPR